jgi:uncharacterized cupredoxin-like copper-binding protein
MTRIKWHLLLALVAILGVQPVSYAHGDEHGKTTKAKAQALPPEQKPWGIAGDPKKVTRTIKMDMFDEMRFNPSEIRVKRGDTIRFEVRNSGKTLHELVIGTMDELNAHAALMKKFPDMEHDEPYMAHVRPGGMEEIVWTFNRAGEFNFACLVAGHLEAGMLGKVVVK